jgi:hypothetical protein
LRALLLGFAGWWGSRTNGRIYTRISSVRRVALRRGKDIPSLDTPLSEETTCGTGICDTRLCILLGITRNAVCRHFRRQPKAMGSPLQTQEGGGENKSSFCAYLVPGLFTSGSATHCSVDAHGARTNFPLTHCASWPCTHACSPEVHDEPAVRLWNFRFSACASWPFCSVNGAAPLPRRWC